MEIHRVCSALRQRVSVALLEAADQEEITEILIAALYETSRSIIPLLGSPKRTLEYQQWQSEVLEVISFLCIPLVRRPGQERRAVAVLAEIGEGCLDQQLRKKLTVYAHELLAKTGQPRVEDPPTSGGGGLRWLFGALVVVVLPVCLSWPLIRQQFEERSPAAASLPETSPAPAGALQGPAVPPPAAPSAGEGGEERAQAPAKQLERPSAEPTAAPVPAVPTTKVRIVNNQVLVPVTLKNGGEVISVELVLDTGASRTVVHDAVAARLQIDPRQAKPAMSEVADGRVIRSRIAKVDSVAVGPFVLAPAELEVISYGGAEGGRDGLLGMDFLGKHRYQIDMEREVIRWF